MSQAALFTQLSQGVMEVVINRPERKNAFTNAMYEAFAGALHEAAQDPGIRVVLVRAEGADFSAGNDLMDFLQQPPAGEGAPVYRFLMALAQFPKPIIAAVSGYAIGIGTTLLLHADLVYAAPTTRFQLPFVNLALVPEAGSSLLLPLRAGPLVAAELLMLGEPFDAERALRYQIINEVIDDKKLLETVRAKASALAKKPAEALRLTKQLLRKPLWNQLKQQMDEEVTLFSQQLQSPEAKAAIQGFFDKKSR